MNFKQLSGVRNMLGHNVLETIRVARTGHLGACCSSLELMTVLYFGGILRFDKADPRHPLRDYVLNRGHLGPLKYNIFHLIGWLNAEEMTEYRQYGSRLAGHEDMGITPGVDISPSGSLGMTLSYAVGAALGFRDANMPNRVFCFLGDGEEQEGNVAEAARHAGHIGLKRLICVIDCNGGQLSTRVGQTDSTDLSRMWSAYGWQVVDLADGHNLNAVYSAYEEAVNMAEQGPVCIIAQTVKGNGVPGCEKDYCGFHVFHGSEPSDFVRRIDIESAIETKGALEQCSPDLTNCHLPIFEKPQTGRIEEVSLERVEGLLSQYEVELSFLTELDGRLGDRLYVVTSDYPPRNFVYAGDDDFVLNNCHYHNVGLREQHMTALVHGLAQVRPDAFFVIMCGDAFLYRHADQINVLAQGGTRVLFYSVQGGISGSRNGPTHQSSGQPGALLTMPGVVVEEPHSAEDLIDASNRALNRKGPTYIRIHKLAIPWSLQAVTRKNGFEVVRHFPDGDGTIVACGMIMPEAIEAADRLEASGRQYTLISIRTLSDCVGFGEWITPDKPLLVFYNGAPRVVEGVTYKEVFHQMVGFPSEILVRGFEMGVTGSVEDLFRHFRLDANSIEQLCS